MLHNSTHRVQFLSKLLRKKRQGLTFSQIEEALEAEDFEKISERGLRKALNKMHNDPLIPIERVGTGYRDRYVGTTTGGSSKPNSLAPHEMLRLSLLAQTDISQVLPRILREELAPHQEQARAHMAYLKKAKGKDEDLLRWVDRVRLRRPSVRLAVDREEPEIKTEVETAVHHALTNRLPLTIKYFSGHLSENLEEASVYPIGLDCQLRWVTLVCQFAEPYRTQQARVSEKYGEDYVQLPMHRISKAEFDEQIGLPHGFDSQFDMEKYLSRAEPDRPRGGEKRFTQGQKIRLVALIKEASANDLIESPLETVGGPQLVELEDNGWFRLTVELIQSDNLLWWCVAMAGDMVVIEPESFRQEVMQLLDKGRALYEQD